MDQHITLIGNLVEDPELRVTPGGTDLTKLRLACNSRVLDRDTGEWKDGEPLYLNCTVWRRQAENVAESLTKGTRVVVIGRLRSRTVEKADGDKRTLHELDVDEIGASVKFATVKVTKMERRNGGSDPDDDQWANPPA